MHPRGGGGHAVKNELQSGDMIGAGKCRLNRALIAEGEEKAFIIAVFRPQLWRVIR